MVRSWLLPKIPMYDMRFCMIMGKQEYGQCISLQTYIGRQDLCQKRWPDHVRNPRRKERSVSTYTNTICRNVPFPRINRLHTR